MNYDDFTTVYTTTDLNGYPRNERTAIIAETRTELAQIKSDLIAQGHEVEEVYLHRRAGQGHWHRTGTAHFQIDFATSNDADTKLEITAQTQVDSMMSEQYPDDWFDEDSHRQELKDELEMIQDSLEGDEKATLFLDGFGLLYYVTNESTGYTYDTHEYQLGFLVNEIDSDDE